PATRLRVPEADDPAGTVEFRDLAYGPRREVLARECGDFLVRRSDGVVAYQLAVVVDDALMGVTQVVRGRDLLGSCARQIYLGRLLSHPAPQYGHVPLLVAPDGRRLSKRDRDLDLGVLRERGVAPERIVGALAAAAGLV
ncbi:MAG TPA: tRNA glutamyl-Q(34) synthetase GluQRS, partial [Olsenella sp.]|nr:tRNA glutamyl-Q(34) synthetase GluQRS [Olsenella sp.]